MGTWQHRAVWGNVRQQVARLMLAGGESCCHGHMKWQKVMRPDKQVIKVKVRAEVKVGNAETGSSASSSDHQPVARYLQQLTREAPRP